MSYSRWSSSCWYAFYNTEGKLSLWYSLDDSIEWDYDTLKDWFRFEDEALITQLVLVYGCTRAQAIEGIQYINMFISDKELV